MDNQNNTKDYDVGYKKPPQHSQFKKGQSGNPKGRPKNKKKSFETLVQAELEKNIEIVENGSAVQISKRELLAKTIVNEAIKTNPRALKLLSPMLNHGIDLTLGDVSQMADVVIYIPDNGRDPQLSQAAFDHQAELGYTDKNGKLLPPYK